MNNKKSFDNFVITQKNKIAYEKAKAFIQSDRGLYLFGSSGTGKTHLALACYEILPRNKVFISVPDLLLRIRASFNNKFARETEEEIIDELTGTEKLWEEGIERIYPRKEYFILDDFGAEKVSDFTLETMYVILNRRIRSEQFKVFITSNFSLTQIAKIMSDRIASRITELCDVVEIAGADWRLKSAK